MLISKVYKAFVDLILPPRCMVCGAVSGQAHQVCGSCWGQMNFITRPHCQRCGLPMAFDQGNLQCAPCLKSPPPYSLGRSVFRYDGKVRDIILKFKHGDATYLAPGLARWMHQSAGGLLDGGDYLVPVPLHRWRLFKRRYNQSSVVARQLGKLCNIPLLDNGLVRTRATQSQHHKNRDERRRNVRGAFDVPQRKKAALKGKVVILIDDVWTTGATLEACTLALKKAGVKEVRVVTLARVSHGC